MIKLSEIIKTDCYINCGSNEKLREVYPLIDVVEYSAQKRQGIFNHERFIQIAFFDNKYQKATNSLEGSHSAYIHHISQIDLTQ
jgi:type III secretory pathway lipoprotein EscJ